MASVPIINWTMLPDSGVFPTPISTQLSLTNAAIGKILCLVMSELASDLGFSLGFLVPTDYSSAGKLLIKGILDGAPGASEVLAFGVQGLNPADNATVDAAFSAEDPASATIGSSGSGHADEDQYHEELPFSNLTLTAGLMAYIFFYIDISVNTYGGNFLLTDLSLDYTPT